VSRKKWIAPDEMYQDAGEKGIEHPDPDDPPRPRANSRRGHGTFNDRPPVSGVVGRESGEIRLEVADSTGAEELGEFVHVSCLSGTTANTDEWSGYNRVRGRHDRIHATVDHSGPKSTWAIDSDGDGVREVHCDTMEGICTVVRNLLRPFRGVGKWCESQYVAMFQRGHNFKEVTDELIQFMLRIRPYIELAS
jgi:transposase